MQAQRAHKLSIAHGAYEMAKLEVAYGLLKQQESFAKQQSGKQLWGSSILVNSSSVGKTLMNSSNFFSFHWALKKSTLPHFQSSLNNKTFSEAILKKRWRGDKPFICGTQCAVRKIKNNRRGLSHLHKKSRLPNFYSVMFGYKQCVETHEIHVRK